jgi:hypothetical protein
MPYTWHGRDTGGVVWEGDITRYYYVSGEEILADMQYEDGQRPILRVGTRLKITKREAHQFFKRGYYEWSTMVYDKANKRWDRKYFPLSKGHIGKDIETRVLKEFNVQPEDVAPPKRKKK